MNGSSQPPDPGVCQRCGNTDAPMRTCVLVHGGAIVLCPDCAYDDLKSGNLQAVVKRQPNISG